MAVGVRLLKRHRLIVASLSGRVDGDELRATVRRVADDPDFVWNFDRLLVVEPEADLSEIDLGDLFAVKGEMIRRDFVGRDAEAAALPAYRIAIVCSHPGNSGILKLFVSLWEIEQAPYVAIRLFEAAADALAWLGREEIPDFELRGGRPLA